jgi:hypothetical protein
LAYLPQYDRFMGIGDEKGELLEMLDPLCRHGGRVGRRVGAAAREEQGRAQGERGREEGK